MEIDIDHILKNLGLDTELIALHFPKLFDPIGKPTQLGFTPREFFYWTDKKVIDIPKVVEGQSPWSRLNIFEILWIRTVQELRSFNIPFSPIVELKEKAFKNLFPVADQYKEMINISFDLIFNDPQLKGFAKSMIENSKEINNETSIKERILFTTWGGIITEILFQQKTIKLLVTKNKKKYEFLFDGALGQEIFEEEIQKAKGKTHLIINLRSIITEFITDPKFEILNEEFGLISQQEKELIKIIRDKKVSEVNIKRESNKDINYTATYKQELKNDEVLNIKRILRMNEYDVVKVTLRNNKHLYIENIKKNK